MTVVEAPTRLHFGLLSLPVAGIETPPDQRLYGGVGLMIDSPKVVVKAHPAKAWLTSGPDADRALVFAKKFVSTLPSEARQPFAIEVMQCPPAHAGLGSGTALALAVAQALANEVGRGDWCAMELAERVDRGLRSAVGVHGFDEGGFIVEAGKLQGEPISPLVGHFEFPTEWRILLITPDYVPQWHGSLERKAFEQITRNNPIDMLCRLIVTGLIPALAAWNIDAFGVALHEYNVKAGEAFADQQQGPYVSSAVAEVIATLQRLRVKGVGQSSWGPTVFAVLESQERAEKLVKDLRGKYHTSITHAAACGSRIC